METLHIALCTGANSLIFAVETDVDDSTLSGVALAIVRHLGVGVDDIVIQATDERVAAEREVVNA